MPVFEVFIWKSTTVDTLPYTLLLIIEESTALHHEALDDSVETIAFVMQRNFRVMKVISLPFACTQDSEVLTRNWTIHSVQLETNSSYIRIGHSKVHVHYRICHIPQC